MKDQIIESLSEAIQEQIESLRASGKTEEEIQNLLEEFNFQDFLMKTTSDFSNSISDYFERTMYEEVLESRYKTDEFLARQEQKWGKAFVAFEAMYIMSVEAASKYCDNISTLENKEEKQFTYFALKLIHGRACQQFLEVLCLMKNGFADGAYARWRSMYELSVIADFIYQYGETVAKAFCEASETNDRYDWANVSGCFKKQTSKHRTFNDIQKKCRFSTEEWKKQYELANKVVHASPQGTFGRLATKEPLNIIPVGRSDYGIVTPAEHSAISLAIISSLFLSVFPGGDNIVAMQYINNWVDVVRKYFFETEKEVFSNPDFKPIIETF